MRSFRVTIVYYSTGNTMQDVETTAMGLQCKRGTQMWEMSFWLFGKASILQFLGIQVTAAFHWVWLNRIRFTALHGPCDGSKHGKQKKYGSSFACCWQRRGTPVAITGHQGGPCRLRPKFRNMKMAFNFLKAFRVIIASNHFESLYNALQFE